MVIFDQLKHTAPTKGCVAVAEEAAEMVEWFVRFPVFLQVLFFPFYSPPLFLIKKEFDTFVGIVRVLVYGTNPASSDQQIMVKVQRWEVLAIPVVHNVWFK